MSLRCQSLIGLALAVLLVWPAYAVSQPTTEADGAGLCISIARNAAPPGWNGDLAATPRYARCMANRPAMSVTSREDVEAVELRFPEKILAVGTLGHSGDDIYFPGIYCNRNGPIYYVVIHPWASENAEYANLLDVIASANLKKLGSPPAQQGSCRAATR
jgi:hypothetical protein